MTLKEKFETTMVSFLIDKNQDKTMIDHFDKIADEFAIGFADWVGQNTINYSSGKFRMKTLKPTLFTSKELLEIYKKESNL